MVPFHSLGAGVPARENVQLCPDFADDPMPAVEALAMVGLTERLDHFPAQLSGGEQQRVAIARAFANSPKILLADEPTGNLDSRNGSHIFDLMTDLHSKNNVTLVLVTHDNHLAEKAQRQIVMKDGRVLTETENLQG